eukprot:409152-Rhodomonas_salina.3
MSVPLLEQRCALQYRSTRYVSTGHPVDIASETRRRGVGRQRNTIHYMPEVGTAHAGRRVTLCQYWIRRMRGVEKRFIRIGFGACGV